jgi:hypothetical protein
VRHSSLRTTSRASDSHLPHNRKPVLSGMWLELP